MYGPLLILLLLLNKKRKFPSQLRRQKRMREEALSKSDKAAPERDVSSKYPETSCKASIKKHNIQEHKHVMKGLSVIIAMTILKLKIVLPSYDN